MSLRKALKFTTGFTPALIIYAYWAFDGISERFNICSLCFRSNMFDQQ